MDEQDELQQLHVALKAAGVGLWDWDLRTGAVHYSAEWKRQLGYQDHEIGEGYAEWSERIHPDDRARSVAASSAFVEKAWPNYAIEFRMRHRDGSYRSMLAQASLIHDAEGRPVRMVGSHIDITEQRRAERALAEREAVLALCIKHSPVPIAMFDRDMRYLATSDAWARAYRIPHDLVGRSHYEIFPELPQSWIASHQRVLAGATEESEGERFPRADGTVDWVRWQARPWYAANGEVGGLVLFCELITDRVAAEAKLRESEERLRQVMDAVPHWILLLDQAGNAAYSNQFGRAHLGSDEATRTVAARMALVHPDDLPGALQRRGQLEASGGPVDGHELRLRCIDGSYHWFTVRATPLPVHPGAEPEFVMSMTDDHARKSLQERLMASQKMEAIGQLAGGVAHDFNNMLMVISSQAESIAEHARLPPEAREDLADLQLAAERAATLTKQLLAFARRSPMAPAPIALNQFMETTSNLVRRSLGGMVSVTLVPSGEELTVEADSTMLTQVILNLALNARDAMPNGGRLTLRASRHRLDAQAASELPDAIAGTWACISVQDTGCGMPSEVTRRVFEPFYTTKEVGRGTGLGLAMVQGIVQQHHGFVSVSSKLGEGSEFRVHLPLIESAAPATAQAEPATEMRGRGQTILLVEDEDSVRALVERMLRRRGYQVISAPNAQIARQLFADHAREIQLLLTDVMMPGGVSGIELASALRKLKPELRIVLSSGQSQDVVARDVAWAGGAHFLQKPYPALELLGLLARLLP